MAEAKFDPAEFARTVERMADGQDLADWSNPAPKFDPKLHKDVRDDAIHGRTIDAYRRALEHHGLKYIPAHRLGVWNDMTPHTEGQWVHPDFDLKLAFTETDVLSMFPGGGEELHDWITDLKRRLSARRAGIVL
jgi:hypothetical protein